MKFKSAVILSLSYTVLIAFIFSVFPGSSSPGDENELLKKRDSRTLYLKEREIPGGHIRPFELKSRKKAEKREKQLGMLKNESRQLYKKEFVEEHFDDRESEYRNLIDQGRQDKIRKSIYFAYEKYIKDEKSKSGSGSKTFFSLERDKKNNYSEKHNDSVPQKESTVPRPDAGNHYQFMAIALANYLSFSNDVKTYFVFRTELLNRMTDPEDRVYFSGASCDAVQQFYTREATMNKTAMYAAIVSYEKELSAAKKDLTGYYGYLASGYYFGGDTVRALDYGRKNIKRLLQICRDKGIDPDNAVTVYNNRHDMIGPELASGNIKNAEHYLTKCISYCNANYSALKRSEQLWGIFANIYYINLFTKAIPPERDYFLGLVLTGFQNKLAADHLRRYLAHDAGGIYRSKAKDLLERTGE